MVKRRKGKAAPPVSAGKAVGGGVRKAKARIAPASASSSSSSSSSVGAGRAVEQEDAERIRSGIAGAPKEGFGPPRASVTPFRSKVLALCAQIPVGSVSTYKAIADALQTAPRAVGGALKRNPYAPLPVPCHRVVKASLAIGGFAGTAAADDARITTKRAFLTHEGVSFADNGAIHPDVPIFDDFDLSDPDALLRFAIDP